MSTQLSAGRVRSTYEFIKAQRAEYSVQVMCRVLGVAPSGYYEWAKQPISSRGQEDARLPRLIRASFMASQGIYGAPRVFLDLREAGETCSKHRVARLMRQNNLRALHGYRTRRWSVGKPAVLIPNILRRQFTVTRPNKAWVTDITYIRTWPTTLRRSTIARAGIFRFAIDGRPQTTTALAVSATPKAAVEVVRAEHDSKGPGDDCIIFHDWST